MREEARVFSACFCARPGAAASLMYKNRVRALVSISWKELASARRWDAGVQKTNHISGRVAGFVCVCAQGDVRSPFELSRAP